MSDRTALGPAVLHLGVEDLTRADQLYHEALGASRLPVEDPAAGAWLLPPGLVVSARTDRARGTDHLEVAVADLDAVATVAAELGLDTETRDQRLWIEDPAVGGGQLALTSPTTRAAPADGRQPGAMGLQGTDHVCLAVEDLPRAVDLLRAAGGTPVLAGDGTVGARAVLLRFDRTKIELLSPIADGPIRRFVERRGGSGIHHLTLFVADVRAAAAGLDAYGLPWVDLDDRTRASWHELYLRPRGTDGLLIQLARTDQDHRTPLTAAQLDDALAGRYDVTSYTMQPIGEDRG
ncbi:MAG: hypothetical protein EA388_16125 [Nitriliruptor sp.]|nr:MAG: hypothetical protein EA388_16125 [Nitriliruptor sp.]